MTSDYEDPASLPSCYGSMDGSRTTYKATQIRGYDSRARRVRYQGTLSRKSKHSRTNLYFVFILVTTSINLAMLCYLIIASESLSHTCVAKTVKPLPRPEPAVTHEYDQVLSNLNTIMHSLTYTLPQVLTANKQSLITRINHFANEMRDTMRLNMLDLSVKLGVNRTIALRTGHLSKDHFVSVTSQAKTTKTPTSEPITLLPPRPTRKLSFYPLIKLDNLQSNGELFHSIGRLNKHHNELNGDLADDIANLNPVFR
ncbi:transmembrane protein [Wufeng Rattus nitidus jeilongvirus 1]|uniref:Transmembrane protein n=1 Tax=Wufeng Rattus nitidus jeilongvirus 1 TaxID=2877503 RepID=A0AAE8XR60_9MONO|nr:transmembrane protein [Wufeng Rattus nitidus jeilongvirus 1]